MADKKYLYSGPVSCATIKVDGKDVDVQLNPGATVTLPDDHPWVQALVSRGRLTEPPTPPKAEAPKTTKPEKGANQ
jgi:hypothetical protein